MSPPSNQTQTPYTDAMPRRKSRLTGMLQLLVRGPMFIAALVIIAFVLGYWGYRSLSGVNLSISDAAYLSLQLFVTDAHIPEGVSQWQLEIARFLAPLTVAYALLVTLVVLAREESQRLRSRWLIRDHVLVIGLGTRGARLAESLAGRFRVVAIERDASNGSSRGLRDSGVPVVTGDGRNRDVLLSAGVTRAAHVVVLVSDDTLALEVAASLTRISNQRTHVDYHVAIRSPILWSELHRLPLEVGRSHASIDFFSVPDRTARAVVKTTQFPDNPSGEPTRVLLRGEGETAERAIVHLARHPDGPFRVELLSDDADAVLELLRRTDPWVLDGTTINAIHAVTESRFDIAIVCGLKEAAGLSDAVEIAREASSNESVFVAVDDRDIEDALTAAGIDLKKIVLVPTKGALYGADLFEGSAIEILARAKHEDYLVQQFARGDSADSNPSLVPWEDLPDSLRVSNRRFAEDVATKLSALDARLAPLDGPMDEVDELRLPAETLDELGQAEHDRWVQDLEADGWTLTDGEKDPLLKRHPLLVPWESLSEAEREKDRDGLRRLPTLLAHVGYELRFGDDPRMREDQ